MMFINPHSDYFSLSKVNNELNDSLGKAIFLFHCNIRSLTKNLTLLNDTSYSLDCRPNIISITETRLNLNPISNVDLSNYHLFHTDSPTLAGSTALYVSKNLKAIPRQDLRIDLPIVELCWVERSPCNNKKHIMIECIYKHPSANLEEFTLKFVELLNDVNLNRYDAYILGDMNIDLLNHHTHHQTSRYLDMLYSHDLLPVITKPTRLTNHTATLIDHIYTNTVNSLGSGILTIGVSDHLSIFCMVDVKLKKQNHQMYLGTTEHLIQTHNYLHDVYAI